MEQQKQMDDDVLLNLYDRHIASIERLLAISRHKRAQLLLLLAHRRHQQRVTTMTARRRTVATPLADDVLRDILPFLSRSDLYRVSLTNWRWHCYAQPLAEQIEPHLVPELSIEEGADEEGAVKVRIGQGACQEEDDQLQKQYTGGRERPSPVNPSFVLSSSLPTSAPPANVLGFRLIRFPTGHVGTRSRHFLHLCRSLIISNRTKLLVKCCPSVPGQQRLSRVVERQMAHAAGENRIYQQQQQLAERMCHCRVELHIDEWVQHGSGDGVFRSWLHWLLGTGSGPRNNDGASQPTKRLTLTGCPMGRQTVCRTVTELLQQFLATRNPSERTTFVLQLPFVGCRRPMHGNNSETTTGNDDNDDDDDDANLPQVAEENVASDELFVAWRCNAHGDGHLYKVIRCMRGHLMKVQNEEQKIECQIQIG